MSMTRKQMFMDLPSSGVPKQDIDVVKISERRDGANSPTYAELVSDQKLNNKRVAVLQSIV